MVCLPLSRTSLNKIHFPAICLCFAIAGRAPTEGWSWLKVLWWDHDGLAIFYKRLEKGAFQFPTDVSVRQKLMTADNTDSQRFEIRADELALLLEGIDLASVKRRKRFERPSAAPCRCA